MNYVIRALTAEPFVVPDTFQQIPSGTFTETYAAGMNSAGDVVGHSRSWAVGNDPSMAAAGTIWSAGSPTLQIPFELDNDPTLLTAISDSQTKDAVGWYGPFHPIHVASGGVTDLSTSSSWKGGAAALTGINKKGLACGWKKDKPNSFIYDFATNEAIQISPLPKQSTCTATAISARGDVVGTCSNNPDDANDDKALGFYYSFATKQLVDLGPAPYIEDVVFEAVTKNGFTADGFIVVGSILAPNGKQHVPTVWKGTPDSFTSSPVPLPPASPPFAGGQANGVNVFGHIVGSCWGLEKKNGPSAFLNIGNQSFDLNTLIPDQPGWDLLSAQKINANGQIVGNGRFNGVATAFLLTPVSSGNHVNIPMKVTIVSSGVMRDGGGTTNPGGPVGPWGDFTLQPSVQKQDVILGLIIDDAAMKMQDRGTRESIRSIALEGVRTRINEMLASIRGSEIAIEQSHPEQYLALINGLQRRRGR
jgi:hypothetical protein